MNVLSLFDGISCGMVALERAGIHVDRYKAYEIDENAIKISKFNYPQIERGGDVFNAEYHEGEFDLLIGGSPCTYWSRARGNGREITTSGLGWNLFSQYVRALKEVKPKYFLYENNASMSMEIRECISNELRCDPIEIDSADFSAQVRKRLYWTNIPVSPHNEKCDCVIRDIIHDNTYKNKSFEKYKETTKQTQDGLAVYWDTSNKGYYSQQNRARSVEGKMNTVTAQNAGASNIWLGGYNYRPIDPIEAERLQTLPDNYTKALSSDLQRIKAVGNGWTVDVIAHIFRGLNDESN